MTSGWLSIATRLRRSTAQLEKMGIERLHARTNTGFELKVQAALIALQLARISTSNQRNCYLFEAKGMYL